MLFVAFGSSASGKTSALAALRLDPPQRLAIHDFDEIGIPPAAAKRFRHEANERWVSRALEYQCAGVDVLLAGQTRPTTSAGPPGCGDTPSIRATCPRS